MLVVFSAAKSCGKPCLAVVSMYLCVCSKGGCFSHYNNIGMQLLTNCSLGTLLFWVLAWNYSYVGSVLCCKVLWKAVSCSGVNVSMCVQVGVNCGERWC
jgi:hypothetical protein